MFYLTAPFAQEGSVPFSSPFRQLITLDLDPDKVYPGLHWMISWPPFPTVT